MREDARQVADSVDLVALATELLGSPKGAGAAAKWPSPVPGHAQTGKSPPMSIFVGRDGRQRWTCFSTGTGGDAIDLVRVAQQVDFDTAYERVKNRTAAPTRTAARKPVSPPAVSTGELQDFVVTCAAALAENHSWLTSHGLDVRTARFFGIGRAVNQPAPGLTWPIADGIVLPTRDRHGQIIGADVRVFGNTKYLALSSDADRGLNFVVPQRRLRADVVAVTEGSADAYTFASHTGIASIGLRSAAVANAESAASIVAAVGSRRIILALDDDAAGNAARDRLLGYIPGAIVLDLVGGDVGDLVASGVRLDRRVRLAVPPPISEPCAGLGR